MLLAALLAGWSIGAPPPDYSLVLAKQYEGRQVTYYSPRSNDPFDAPLTLEAFDPGASPYPATPAPHAVVHGQPAELAPVSDDGQVYARSVRWIEPSGVTLVVQRDGTPSDASLIAIAESVRAESPERWRALRIATRFPPSTRALPKGMKRVAVRRGPGFRLTALLPPGFPVAPEDRRSACYRLTNRGDRSYGYGCGDPTSWARVGGDLFVFGAARPEVRRVRITGEGGVDVTVRTGRARGYPLASFYVAKLPDDACQVSVRDADRRREIGQTGPLPSSPREERRRCGALGGEDGPPPPDGR